jgi:hypothetical protein
MAFAYFRIECDIPLIAITINEIERLTGVGDALNQL